MARESFYIFLQKRFNDSHVEFYKRLKWTRQQWHINSSSTAIPRQDTLKRIAIKLNLKIIDIERLLIEWMKS